MEAFVHLVARADRLSLPLTHDDVAPRLWERLERAFPEAIAAALMPNHLHLLVRLEGLTPLVAAEDARARLAAVVSAFARISPDRRLHFEEVPVANPETDPIKVLRQARYVALNPVRARLVGDPLEWRWSTHRDVLGAVARPWVTADRLARAVGRSVEGFAAWWHRYVAREDDVDPAARLLPRAAAPTELPEVPIADVERAVAAAARTDRGALRRRGAARELFVALAARVGWAHTGVLAARCGITARAIRKALLRPAPAALAAALLCLGDERLRR